MSVQIRWHGPPTRYLAVATSGYITTSSASRNRLAALYVVDTLTDKAQRIASGYPAGASFAPDGSDRFVYALGRSSPITGVLNLFTAKPDRTAMTQLTHDGHSLNPVWGVRGIAFDRELRASKYQIFLLADRHISQITYVRLSRQDQGLVPTAFSASGTVSSRDLRTSATGRRGRLNLANDSAHELTPPDTAVTSAGISRDGRRVLVATTNKVATIPFFGGTPTMLVKHAMQASWNQ